MQKRINDSQGIYRAAATAKRGSNTTDTPAANLQGQNKNPEEIRPQKPFPDVYRRLNH